MISKYFFLLGLIFALLIGWVLFPLCLYKSNHQPIQFNHKVHTGETGGMTCTDCHTTDSDGRFQGIPVVAKCAECHSSPLGETDAEKVLVEQYITPNNEIPWFVYSRQPDNAYFSHASHVTLGELNCEECHGPRGSSEFLEVYHENRISGYSRDIWGANISGLQSESWQGMKMDKCVRCHENRERRDGCVACHK